MTHHLLDVESVLFRFAGQRLDFAKHCRIYADLTAVHFLPQILDWQLNLRWYSLNEALRWLDRLVGIRWVIVVLLLPECFLFFGRFGPCGLHPHLRELLCHRSEFTLNFVSGLSCLDLFVKLRKRSVVELQVLNLVFLGYRRYIQTEPSP